MSFEKIMLLPRFELGSRPFSFRFLRCSNLQRFCFRFLPEMTVAQEGRVYCFINADSLFERAAYLAFLKHEFRGIWPLYYRSKCFVNTYSINIP